MIPPLLVRLREARALVASEAPAPPAAPQEAAVLRRITAEIDQAIARLDGSAPGERDLVSVICHDLKDPLASIVMGAGFLKKTLATDDPGARRVVDAIARSADRMNRVVGDFHDLSKLDCGRLAVALQPCDVVAAVQTVTAPLKAQAAECGIALDLDVPAARVVAVCDRDRVGQIISKLVGNAIKFTPPNGRIVVTVRKVVSERESESSQQQVFVSVADTGRGIAPDRLSTIFDHAANARRTPRDGPGLGLAIVRGLVEAQGGQVEVESRLGEGSLFSFRLPAPREEVALASG